MSALQLLAALAFAALLGWAGWGLACLVAHIANPRRKD